MSRTGSHREDRRTVSKPAPAGQHVIRGEGTGAPSSADSRMELVIGRLLQAGVLAAATLVLLGGVLYLHQHAGERVSYATFRGEAAGLQDVRLVLRSAAHGNAVALIQLGVLLLIATPVARVAVAGVAFAWEHDGLYLMISLAVLAVLLAGLLHGL